LSALLAATGEEAWNVKLALQSDPLFAHFKDRLDHLAREKAAIEAEGCALSEAAAAALDRYGEAPAVSRDQMFNIMCDRLSDIEADFESEFSQRAIWALIDTETLMQQALASRLSDRANHAYKVDREAEVVEGKKTDIRLLSVKSDQQAVIEIKLADKGWTFTQLMDALEQQLVGQYLRHDNCKAGCLLITMARTRRWKLPESGRMIDFDQLLSILNERADSIAQNLGHAITLKVSGLDLRPSVVRN
jgi:hypothetical protein